MTRLSALFRAGRGDRVGTEKASPRRRDREPKQAVLPEPVPSVLVDTYDRLVLLRACAGVGPGPDDAAALAGALATLESDPGVATVVVGADGPGPAELWSCLGEVLDKLRDGGTTTVRLVLSGAGNRSPNRPSLAQQIAEAWGIGVIAPEGTVLVVPGGSLFVADPHKPGRGWYLFTAGAKPLPLGPRNPAPTWQDAIGRLPVHTATDCVVEQIPAGVLIRPPRAPAPQPPDLCFAVPVDHRHPTVVVGAPGTGADIPTDDLAALLAALPAKTRALVRLAPGTHKDLLPAAQDVADELGIELEVLTGLPLDIGAAELEASAQEPVRARPILLGPDGKLTWRPFVEAVVCQPAGAHRAPSRPEPRLLRWHPPSVGRWQFGVVHLADQWQVSLTRAGLSLGPRGAARPISDRPVEAGHLAIDVGLPGEPMDESVYAAVSTLLLDLGDDVREFVTMHGLGRFADGGRHLRRLAVQHGVRLLWPHSPDAQPERAGVAIAPEPTRATDRRLAALESGGEAVRDGSAASSPIDPVATFGPAGEGPPGESAAHSTADPMTVLDGGSAGQVEPAASATSDRLAARIVAATNAADFDTATALASELERQTLSTHGESAEPTLEARRVRAHVLRLAGEEALAADLYRRVALTLLATRGPDDPATEQAVANADACWRTTRDASDAWRIGSAIVELRRQVPGPDGRRLRAAERYLAQVDAALVDPPSAALPPSITGSSMGAELPGAFQELVSPALRMPTQTDEPSPKLPDVGANGSDRTQPPLARTAAAQHSVRPGSGPQPRRTAASRLPHIPITPVGTSHTTRKPPSGTSEMSPLPEASTSLPGTLGSGDGRAADAEPLESRIPSLTRTPPSAEPVGELPAEPPTGTVGSTAEPDAESERSTVSAEVSLPQESAAFTHPSPPRATPAPRAAAVRPRTFARRSTEADRVAFRSLAQPSWDLHNAAVSRAITRMPALGRVEPEAARSDLIAVHAYLTVDEGPYSRSELARSLHDGDDRLASYAACLSSGLGRLPSHRGAVVRGGLPLEGAPDGLVPGGALYEAGPVSALTIAGAGSWRGVGGRYLIYSSTGRRVRALLADLPAPVPDEVVFPPGTVFRALDVRASGDAQPIVLLRELQFGETAVGVPGVLDETDQAALRRLDQVLGAAVAPTGAWPDASPWPARCVGPLGELLLSPAV